MTIKSRRNLIFVILTGGMTGWATATFLWWRFIELIAPQLPRGLATLAVTMGLLYGLSIFTTLRDVLTLETSQMPVKALMWKYFLKAFKGIFTSDYGKIA